MSSACPCATSAPTSRRCAAADWISQQWEAARLEATGKAGAVLVLDEIQKIPVWSETVKRLWDEDTRARRPLKVVLLGSAPLLIAAGLTESLAGRFEMLHLPHWSCAEMREAFGWTLEQALLRRLSGRGAARRDPARWPRYIRDALIETTSRATCCSDARGQAGAAAAAVRAGCRYSGQILSYTKMLGQLQDAGNTTTLAHYLDLLAGAGMVRGLPKYAAMRRAAGAPARSCRCSTRR